MSRKGERTRAVLAVWCPVELVREMRVASIQSGHRISELLEPAVRSTLEALRAAHNEGKAFPMPVRLRLPPGGVRAYNRRYESDEERLVARRERARRRREAKRMAGPAPR
jgi:hypothetical protein